MMRLFFHVLLLTNIHTSCGFYEHKLDDYIAKPITTGKCSDDPNNFDLVDYADRYQRIENTASDWCVKAYNTLYTPAKVSSAVATTQPTYPLGCTTSQNFTELGYNDASSSVNSCGSDDYHSSTFTCLCFIKKYVATSPLQETSTTCEELDGYETIDTLAECTSAFYDIQQKNEYSSFTENSGLPKGCSAWSGNANAFNFNSDFTSTVPCTNSQICYCRRKTIRKCTCQNGVPIEISVDCEYANSCDSCNPGYRLNIPGTGETPSCVKFLYYKIEETTTGRCDNPLSTTPPGHRHVTLEYITDALECGKALVEYDRSEIINEVSYSTKPFGCSTPDAEYYYSLLLNSDISGELRTDDSYICKSTSTASGYVAHGSTACNALVGGSFITDAATCVAAKLALYSQTSGDTNPKPSGCYYNTARGGWEGYLQPVTSASGTCENDKKCLCKRWYDSYIYQPTRRSWIDAETFCVAIPEKTEYSMITSGSTCHLVSIHSAIEDTIVLQMTEDDFSWIGLNDQDPENTFVWSDGTSTDYTNWSGGEPNNSGAGTAVLSPDGAWKELGSDALHSSVCKCTINTASTPSPTPSSTSSTTPPPTSSPSPSSTSSTTPPPTPSPTTPPTPSPTTPPTTPPTPSPTPSPTSSSSSSTSPSPSNTNLVPSPTTPTKPLIFPSPSPSSSSSLPPSTPPLPTPSTSKPAAQTGPTTNDVTTKTIHLDPRLGTMRIVQQQQQQQQEEEEETKTRRRLITIQGSEKIKLTGRFISNTVAIKDEYFNFLFGSIVTIGKVNVVPTIDENGRSMTITLPSYETMCTPPCNEDGMYVQVTVAVPFNVSNTNIVCYGKQVNKKNKEDESLITKYCSSSCGASDFSGCPISQGGLWLMKNVCKGYETIDTSICLNELTSEQCAYTDDNGKCLPCPTNSICPGGKRIWPKDGFWKLKESDVKVLPIECDAPSKQRCRGWNAAESRTQCGHGYEQGTYLCKSCASGYYQTLSNRTCQSCTGRSSETDGDNGGNSSEEIGWALFAFALVIIALTVLVFVTAIVVGGDRSTGLSRASSFLFYSLVSLQLIAQIGTQATGFEHPVVLRLYWWLSVMSTIDTAESLPVECMDTPPFFWSNLTMVSGLCLLILWLLWMFIPLTRPESICRICLNRDKKDLVRKKCTPQLRRYILSTMILIYAVVAKTSVESIHCINNGNNTYVQNINPEIICYENVYHYNNGILGWCTLITYCLGLPIFMLWLVSRASWFDHAERKRQKESSGGSSVVHSKGGSSISGDGNGGSRGSVVATFMTSGGRERMKHNKSHSSEANDAILSSESKQSSSVTKEPDQYVAAAASCCSLRDLGTVRARQRSSVLRFVFHRPIVYVSYKPLIECDYHIKYLYFRPTYLVLLFVLASLGVVPKSNAGLRLIIGGIALLIYISATLIIKPLRRTRQWKLPVKCLIVIIGLLALTLNYIAGLLDQDGEHWHKTIRILSFAVIICTGLLICIVIPISAVYELWSGAVREKKCKDLRALYKRRKNVLQSQNFQKEKNNPKWTDMELMASDDLDELKELITVLKQHDTDANRRSMKQQTKEFELVSIGSLPRMTDNPLQQQENKTSKEKKLSFYESNPLREKEKKEKKEKEEKEKEEYLQEMKEKKEKKEKKKSRPSSGWETHRDDDSGALYYHHPTSRHSVWSVEETWSVPSVELDIASTIVAEIVPEIDSEIEEIAGPLTDPVTDPGDVSIENAIHDVDVSSSENETDQTNDLDTIEAMPTIEITKSSTIKASKGGRSNTGQRKMRRMTQRKLHHPEKVVKRPKSTELEDVRQRILDKMANMHARQGGYHARTISQMIAGEGNEGIEINDRRGDWMMIHDDITGTTLYYNSKTLELGTHRPKGWVKMLAKRFNREK